MTKIDDLELSSATIAAPKAFPAKAFGSSSADCGPAYQRFADAGLDGVIDGRGAREAGRRW